MEQLISLVQHSWAQLIIVWLLALLGIKTSNRHSMRLMTRLRRDTGHPELEKRSETIAQIFKSVVNISILAAAVMITLNRLGIDVGPILATAGVLGVAVGLGAQRLIQDVISGFFILLDDQIRVGDVVELGGKSGVVEHVSMRMTVLRDLSGNVHYIRNASIDTVTNMTKEYSRMVFDIGVSYREDVDEVIAAMKQVDEQMRMDPAFGADILEPLEVLGLERFDNSAVVVRARYKTAPIRQWDVGREFRKRLKKKFGELDIEIPFPHTTLYMGRAKDGSAPPLNIRSTGSDDASDAAGGA